MRIKLYGKSQAALEFLTTYGWAFLVILIVIAALSYFGILSPSRLLPNRCNFGSEFGCIDYGISATNNNLRIRLKNNLGIPITIQSLTLGSEGSAQLSCTVTPFDYSSQLWGAGSWSQSGLISYTAANVNNGNKGDVAFHTDQSGIGSYLQLDVGSGASREFTKLDISILAGGGNVNAVWDIQYSDDSSNWLTAYSGASASAIAPGTTGSFTWNSVGAHRYWRLYKVNPAGGGGYHSEIQFYEGSPASLQVWKSSESHNLAWSNCNLATAGFVAGEKGKVLVKVKYYSIRSGPAFANEVNGEVFSNII